MKIYIFTKNTPWGIEKKGDGSNIYKNVINFVPSGNDTVESLRDDFINNNFMPAGQKYKDELDKQEATNYNPKNELNFESFQSLTTQQQFAGLDDLMNADYAVVKGRDDNVKFYALAVIENQRGQIKFNFSLDIFTTYNLDKNLFIDKSKVLMVKGHLKRFNADKSINWSNVLKNNFDIEPVKQTQKLPIKWEWWTETTFSGEKNNDGYTKPEAVAFNNFVKEIKWVVVYIHKDKVNQVLGYEVGSANFFSSSTKLKGIELPYIILLFPYHPSVPIAINDTPKQTGDVKNTIQKIIKDNAESIINLSVLTNIGIKGLDYNIATSLGYEGDVVRGSVFIKRTNIKITKVKGIKAVRILVSQGLFGGLDGWVLKIDEIDELEPLTGEIDITINKTIDPINYHPNLYRLQLKRWEAEGKNYNLPALKIDNNKIKLYSQYIFSPTENITLYWFIPNELITKNKLITGDYFIDNNDDTLPLSQDQLSAYIRDNRNTFNTEKYYSIAQAKLAKQQSIFGTVGSVIGLAGSMTSGNPLAILGAGAGVIQSGFGIANANLSISRLQDSYKAQIKDLQNRLPTVKLGNSVNANVILNNYETGIDDISVLVYKLLDYQNKKINDIVKVYGYSNMENVEVKNVIDTRQAFNYIEAQNVFSTIKGNFSARIKQEISQAFANGLTVWHYRTKGQALVIQNYDVANDEV